MGPTDTGLLPAAFPATLLGEDTGPQLPGGPGGLGRGPRRLARGSDRGPLALWVPTEAFIPSSASPESSGLGLSSDSHRGCCPGNLPPQERSGLPGYRAPRLLGSAHAPPSRPQKRPSSMPWPLRLCPAWPPSPSVLFLGTGIQVRSPGVQSWPLHGHLCPWRTGLNPAAEQPWGRATPGASDGGSEGILLSGGGEIVNLE